jgi:(p)ppGpp synthase/HD superfamily hydrolase
MGPDVLRSPAFAGRGAIVREAFDFARERYVDALRPDGKPFEHPLEVARLVAGSGQPDEAVAAALLHDVVEDADTTVAQVQARAGPEVAAIVAALTEDPAIEDYRDRKAALRAAATGAGPAAAAVFVADKLASAGALLQGGKPADPEKLEHYERTLVEVESRHPDTPLLDELRDALARLRATPG